MHGAQFRLADANRLADTRLAWIAIKIGGHDQTLAGQCVAIRHHRPLAAREHIAGRITRTAQAYSVGIGECCLPPKS